MNSDILKDLSTDGSIHVIRAEATIVKNGIEARMTLNLDGQWEIWYADGSMETVEERK